MRPVVSWRAHTQLFVRGIGEVTDIVEKEMYSFEDRLNGEHLTLRPEGTASLVRATVEHNLLYDGGKRMWYIGPMFRHERPQRGRYRQLHQIGAEALGFAGPDVDAELILLAVALFQRLGLTQWRLEINSLGQPAERQAHRARADCVPGAAQDVLDEEAARRMYTNPLRVLDANPRHESLVNAAPKLLDYLGEVPGALRGLKAIWMPTACPWTVNPHLVRGLDYYNLTVFEFVTDLLGSQGTICAGGRYDDLIEQIGGKPARPWAGPWAWSACWSWSKSWAPTSLRPSPMPMPSFPMQRPCPRCSPPCGSCAKPGCGCKCTPPPSEGMGSMKSQFKKADASGAHFALIFGGERAAARGEVTVKALRDGQGAQTTQPLAAAADWAHHLQSRA